MDESQPFAGIRVVEFGQFVAVPFCSQLLAQGGAHVIKVEALEGDPVCGNGDGLVPPLALLHWRV